MNEFSNQKTPKRSSFLLWFGIAWLVLSAPFILFGRYMLQVDQQFELEGIVTTAKVVGKRLKEEWNSKEKRTDRSYLISYEFTLSSGERISNEGGIDSERWQTIKEGDDISVQYLPSNPSNNRLTGGGEKIAGYLIMAFGAIGTLIGLGSLAVEVKSRTGRSRLLREGTETEGTVEAIMRGSLTVNNVPYQQVRYTYCDDRGRIFRGLSENLPPDHVLQWVEGSKGRVKFDPQQPEKSIWLG